MSGVALVTGGTRGLGLAIGLALGRRGWTVTLTHKWGSADEDAIARAFADADAPPPRIVEADAGEPADTEALLDGHAPVDLLISNVCVALPCPDPLALRERDLARTLAWSSWPVWRTTEAIRRRWGRPLRVIATSSDGPDRCYPGYVAVALAKTALEAMVSQLGRKPDVRAFALRTRQIRTESLDRIFPGEAGRVLQRFASYGVTSDEAASAAVALASGALDGLNGQVLTVDRGATLLDHALHVVPLVTAEVS